MRRRLTRSPIKIPLVKIVQRHDKPQSNEDDTDSTYPKVAKKYDFNDPIRIRS